MQEGHATKQPPTRLAVPTATAAPTIRGSYSPGWSALGNKSFGQDLTPELSDIGSVSVRSEDRSERGSVGEKSGKVSRCHCSLL